MARSGLMTLSDAVDGYQQGVAWRDQQEQVQRQRKQQSVYDGAGKRANSVIEAERQQFVGDGGDPAKFRPSDVAMLKASEQFGQHFAENGDWQSFRKNEVSVQPQRIRVRAQALQQFSVDKDVKKLISTVYATIPDGNDVKDVQVLPGGAPVNRGTPAQAAKPAPVSVQQGLAQFDAETTNPLGAQPPATPEAITPATPGDGRLGAPSGAPKVRVTLSNGETREVDPARMLRDIQVSLQDPVAASQKEIELNYQRALQAIKTAGQVEVEGVRSGFTAQRDAARDAAAKDRGLAVAEVGAKSRVQAANISAASRDYRTDNPPPRSGGGLAGAGGGSNGVQSRTENQDGYVVLNFRDGTSRMATVDGKPVRSQAWSKRVDRVAADLAKSTDGIGKPMAELRQAAETMLAGKAPVQAAPAAGGGKDYSNLWGAKK